MVPLTACKSIFALTFIGFLLLSGFETGDAKKDGKKSSSKGGVSRRHGKERSPKHSKSHTKRFENGESHKRANYLADYQEDYDFDYSDEESGEMRYPALKIRGRIMTPVLDPQSELGRTAFDWSKYNLPDISNENPNSKSSSEANEESHNEDHQNTNIKPNQNTNQNQNQKQNQNTNQKTNDEQICGLPEADENQVCISIKLPWKNDPIYFCTPKANIKMKECPQETTLDSCFDDARNDSLKIGTPWDCCPHISVPNSCDIVQCPPPPFNRTCKSVKKDDDCCETYYCGKEDPAACKLLKPKPSCTEPPKGKENCTRFRDPFGCCTKFQCNFEEKPGYCPKITLAVKMVTKMATNSEGKQIALLVPQNAVSASEDIRCIGDDFCPDDQKCCAATGKVNKLRTEPNSKDNNPKLIDGACRKPVFSEAESEPQGRSFKKTKSPIGRSYRSHTFSGRSLPGISSHGRSSSGRSGHGKSSHGRTAKGSSAHGKVPHGRRFHG